MPTRKRYFPSSSTGFHEQDGCLPVDNFPTRKKIARTEEKKREYMASLDLWELPDTLLYEIAQYCLPPMERASFLCQKIAVLCKASNRSLLLGAEQNQAASTPTGGLWNCVLQGDYGVVAASAMEDHCRIGQRRRICQRLRRSPIDQVKDAHKLMRDNTEIAYYYLWEITSSCNYSSRGKDKKKGLTRSILMKILDTYGPRLMYNKTMSSGGIFLVEVCRCRNTSSASILKCVRELIEERGALINKSTHESTNSSLTALCVAAVRGMPKVVEYLLARGAAKDITCSGRFRLHTNPKKSIRCNNATPLQFAQAMLDEEMQEGARSSDLGDLIACMDLLQQQHHHHQDG